MSSPLDSPRRVTPTHPTTHPRDIAQCTLQGRNGTGWFGSGIGSLFHIKAMTVTAGARLDTCQTTWPPRTLSPARLAPSSRPVSMSASTSSLRLPFDRHAPNPTMSMSCRCHARSDLNGAIHRSPHNPVPAPPLAQTQPHPEQQPRPAPFLLHPSPFTLLPLDTSPLSPCSEPCTSLPLPPHSPPSPLSNSFALSSVLRRSQPTTHAR
jgi:hypothetical protein